MRKFVPLFLMAMLSCEGGTQNSITDMYPAQEILPPLVTARKAAVEWGAAEKAPSSWTVLQCSDLHGSTVQLSRIVAFYQAYAGHIDAAIHTGDVVACYYDDPYPWDQVEGAAEVMNVIGNHDCWKGHLVWAQTDIPYDATQGEAFERFLAPYIQGWGVTRPQGAEDPSSAHYQACYYYKDYAASGIRMVVLDCIHYEEAQHAWFMEVLEEAREKGLAVVAVQHYPAQSGLELIESGFTERDESMDAEPTPPEGKQMERMPDAAFAAVDAFLDGGGTFVCWLGGHTHLDFIGHVRGHQRQLQVLLDKAGELDDYMQEDRTPGTRNQDAFNLVTVNPSRHALFIQRVGCSRDQYLRSKTLFVYDYKQREVLVNE